MITSGGIFPYAVLPEVRVNITNVELLENNGATRALPLAAAKGGRLALYGPEFPAWSQVSISFDCAVTKQEMASVARDPQHVALTVAIRDSSTRSRWCATSVGLHGEYRWSVEVVLSRAHVRGSVDLIPSLVRTAKADTAVSGQAAHDGALLGWSAPFTVYVDEPALLPLAGDVDVRWVSFSEDPALQHARARMFDIDILGDRPLVRLNKDHEQLRRALGNKTRQGPQAALRQSLMCYIVQEAWMTIALDALEQARVAREDADGEAAFPTTDWKADALKRVLKNLFPSMTEESALERALELYEDRASTAHLVAQLSSAIQGTINVKRNLLRHLEELP